MLSGSVQSLVKLALLAGVSTLTSILSAQSTVAITEYMNNPSGPGATDEWVELFNYGETDIQLGGWRMQDDDTDDYVIPAGTFIPAKSFLIIARDKARFEALWLDGAPTSAVIQYSGDDFAMNDNGTDELRLALPLPSTSIAWRLAYGANSNNSRATFYALNDISTTNTNHGEKGIATITRSGLDAATGRLGYEGNEFTEDPWAYAGASDFGSPLRGAYTGALNPPPPPTSWTLSLTSPPKSINPGIRGLAIADQALNRGDNSDKTGIIPCLETARGSAIRGVAGGLYADMYDWKRRNDMPRPPTLEFLRWARDYDEELYITANTRGLTIPDPEDPSHRIYYTSDTVTLAQLAADWVYYTNHIVQNYRQGDTISDTRAADILNSLTWSSAYVNGFGTADNFTKLLAPDEAAVPPVIYWEIGNEPTISLNNAYSVSNGFTFTANPGEYRDRYIAITTAMLEEDPNIKVGPCLVNARSANNALMLNTLLDSPAQIDFISYHPYGSMGDYPNLPLRQQDYLAGVYTEQQTFLQQIKDYVAFYRPAEADNMEYVASEVNVSDYPTNNTFQEGTMAHALGSMETVMSYARLGLSAAHYWIWITATPTYLADTNRFAVTMAYEKLRDKLGDELIGAFDANDKVHIYVIRDSSSGEIGVWALNFSHSADIPFDLTLTNGPSAANAVVTHTALRAINGGPTNLFSANLNPEINFGVARRDVDWSVPQLLPEVDPAELHLVLPASTITLLTIQPSSSAIDGWSLY